MCTIYLYYVLQLITLLFLDGFLGPRAHRVSNYSVFGISFWDHFKVGNNSETR